MYEQDEQLGVLDLLTIIEFIVTIQSYNELISKSDIQKTTNNILQDLHGHFERLDKKADYIIHMLEKEGVKDGI